MDMMKMKMRMGMGRGRSNLARVSIVREYRPEGRLENVRRNQDRSARNIKGRLRYHNCITNAIRRGFRL
jgi:hypothetical protein